MMFAFLENRKPETAETIPGLSLQDTVKYAVDSLDDVIVYLDIKIKFVPKKGNSFNNSALHRQAKVVDANYLKLRVFLKNILKNFEIIKKRLYNY